MTNIFLSIEAAEDEIGSSINRILIDLTRYPNPVAAVLYLDWKTSVDIKDTLIWVIDVKERQYAHECG